MPLDSTNWSLPAETETKPAMFSLEGLIAWLETQPPNGEYEFGVCDGTCLIGLYAKAIGYSDWMAIHETSLPRPPNWPPFLPYSFGQLACGDPHTFGAALSRARSLLASRNSNAYLAETR